MNAQLEPSTNPATWPKDRKAELATLQELLEAAKALNRGSGAIERLQKIIVLAEALTKFELDHDRPSFVDFLITQANPK